MAAMHWQLRHAVPPPDCDMTATAFMGLKRRRDGIVQNLYYR
jgi:hypothetical protein